jgi:hypothetical protein
MAPGTKPTDAFAALNRAITFDREVGGAYVGEMQQKLAALKQAQQDLERERSTLEELRRRQIEFTTGRQEMAQHLTRGVGLLEEAEFDARREAEQMARSLLDLREALGKVQSIQEETWTNDNLNVELTRASTIIENARMEWNSARMKFSVLNDTGATETPGATPPDQAAPRLFPPQSYAEICKLGLAITWPLALVALGIFLVLLLRR